MPRRYIIPMQEIYKRRALEWEYHFKNRRTVAENLVMYDQYRVTRTLQREMPAPIMRADGSLLECLKTVHLRE